VHLRELRQHLEERVAALHERLPALTLDRSYASIDALEDVMLDAIGDRDLERLVADYLVVTLASHAAGAKPVFVDKYGRTVVRILKLAADPTLTAQAFRQRPARCFLRDDVERFDLAARRELLERVQPHEPGEVAEVSRLLAALPALATAKTARCRAATEELMIAIGRAVHASAPEARYRLSDDPRMRADYGWLFIGKWNVRRSITWVMRGDRPADGLVSMIGSIATT